MELTNCPECSTEISGSPLKCTKCGVQLRKPKRGFFGKLFKWVFIIYTVLLVIGLFAHKIEIEMDKSAARSEQERISLAMEEGAGYGFILAAFLPIDIVLGLLVLLTWPRS